MNLGKAKKGTPSSHSAILRQTHLSYHREGSYTAWENKNYLHCTKSYFCNYILQDGFYRPWIHCTSGTEKLPLIERMLRFDRKPE